MVNCAACGSPYPENARNCPSCQADLGFPNVRAAEDKDEQNVLEERTRLAHVSAKARNCETVLDAFADAVTRSRAVICNNFGVLSWIVSSDVALYASYYGMLEAGVRLPEGNKWDRFRESVDAALFPNYHKYICFAALSLDKRGVDMYGKYAIFLREAMIATRATVFEENSRLFCEKRKIALGESIPRGFRTIWKSRDRLAAAKLHSKISGVTTPRGFAAILLDQGGHGADADFVEVHIYGPIHRRAIEFVVGPKPGNKAEFAIWKRLERQLGEVGASLEVV